MALMRGEPLLTKLAILAKYVVLPGAMAAALVYSPPGYTSSKSEPESTKWAASRGFLDRSGR